ncbi:unnamed protein product [Euphydryas editha]|uniref:Uncharacterized protein n=1 Tax=Euphydryas editha TaxID=104508 RepID=A0AAU9TQE5_EUPED|nr:unnamed protein product [Euphydryas editha]
MASSKIVKCYNCNIVICEVLAFIQNKVDVMDEESIVRICISSFSATDIEHAKCLLFESIKTTKRKITRKRNGRTNRDIYDLIAVFKETDPEETPIFVAREQIVILWIAGLRAYRTLQELNISCENEMIGDRSTSPGSGGVISSLSHSQATQRSVPLVQTHSEKEARLVEAPASTAVSNNDSQALTQDRLTTSGGTAVSNKNDRAFTYDGLTTAAVNTKVSHQGDLFSNPAGTVTLARIVGVDGHWKKKEKRSEEWELVQRKRHRNRFSTVEGKAATSPSEKFKAADIKISLFINNVLKETTESDITNYIFNRTQVKVVPIKINVKSPREYNAYKIDIPKTMMALFFKDNFWPEGITFRKFIDFKKKIDDGHSNQ